MGLVLTPLLLTACTGAMMADLHPGRRVDVDGAAFTVEWEGSTALVRNFETAADNQDRLRRSAQKAAEVATGCRATGLTQDPMRNLYEVTLNCRQRPATLG